MGASFLLASMPWPTIDNRPSSGAEARAAVVARIGEFQPATECYPACYADDDELDMLLAGTQAEERVAALRDETHPEHADAVTELRDQLRADLDLVWPDEAADTAGGVRYVEFGRDVICRDRELVTGGTSWGDDPSESYSAISRLAQFGVTRINIDTELGQAKRRFRIDEAAWSAFAAAHADELDGFDTNRGDLFNGGGDVRTLAQDATDEGVIIAPAALREARIWVNLISDEDGETVSTEIWPGPYPWPNVQGFTTETRKLIDRDIKPGPDNARAAVEWFVHSANQLVAGIFTMAVDLASQIAAV